MCVNNVLFRQFFSSSPVHLRPGSDVGEGGLVLAGWVVVRIC